MRPPGAALALGAAVTGAAVAFGSRPLGVAGIGLVLAGAAARAWAGLVRGPVAVRLVASPEPATEGDRVTLAVEVSRRSRLPVAWWALEGDLGRLGAFSCRLRGRGRRGTAALELGPVARGRYAASGLRVQLGEPLGLETVTLPAEAAAGGALVVRPRVVPLEGLFSEAGRAGAGGRRLLLRRPAGFDLHSVREYEQGESLRRVHWPTTARRGRLMVKELEDAPRDAVAVVLDCDPAGAAGSPPDSSFDAAARAAASLVAAHAARGRAVWLLTTGRVPALVRAGAGEAGLAEALGVLAAAEPDAVHPLARWLRSERNLPAGAGELVVVTGTLGLGVTQALLAAARHRPVSVVLVDAPSFAGRPSPPAPGPLRLAAAGIPVAVLRRGAELAAVLGPPRQRERAHG